ncbi:hypothetical protein GSU68_15475 [Rathayibacter sp. VKM Ac-2759]|uniref:hypothetical protein n=1 Tax=Rathayibacter sp. VKM Ac-2759 TaxID=2609252 RepID=UPI0013191A85|nr:hypothetical protein [Rathayibacter sp. VKM Ac-2759]QHC67830.1 hypothetical protein GSU68_15475 [Rathayibacter sp. VKM Ac-2759]
MSAPDETARDLSGSALDRLRQLEALDGDALTSRWLVRQLRLALEDLAALEPVADAERERREDF